MTDTCPESNEAWRKLDPPTPDGDPQTFKLPPTLSVGGHTFTRHSYMSKGEAGDRYQATNHYYHFEQWRLVVHLDNYGSDDRPTRCSIYMARGSQLWMALSCFVRLRERECYGQDVEYYADKRMVLLALSTPDDDRLDSIANGDDVRLPGKVSASYCRGDHECRLSLYTPRCISALGEVRFSVNTTYISTDKVDTPAYMRRMIRWFKRNMTYQGLALPR